MATVFWDCFTNNVRWRIQMGKTITELPENRIARKTSTIFQQNWWNYEYQLVWHPPQLSIFGAIGRLPVSQHEKWLQDRDFIQIRMRIRNIAPIYLDWTNTIIRCRLDVSRKTKFFLNVVIKEIAFKIETQFKDNHLTVIKFFLCINFDKKKNRLKMPVVQYQMQIKCSGLWF